MREAAYQSKLMDKIVDRGGVVVNGMYTKDGESDLQAGMPVNGIPVLVYVAIEVKTEKDYYRVMKCIDTDYNVINDKGLKKHEALQMYKIRNTRKRGGLALVAFNIEQVDEYIRSILCK